MNYSNHSLRTNLQEWKNRLYKSTYEQFGNQLKYLINNLDNSKQLNSLISDAVLAFPLAKEKFEETINTRRNLDVIFENEIDQAAYGYQFLKFYIEQVNNNYNIHQFNYFSGRDFDDKKTQIIEKYISPIIYYLHDKLDKLNSTIYLLEKYKRRTEWFTRYELYKRYSDATKSYEQIFEDDLRLFLFDQGIDYPFSTPLSTSGRADIIGEIETDDPLIVEIKIFDKSKGYGKDRIKDGFSQVIKYTSDYNKDVGYLVIYNLEDAEINFKFNNPTKVFPPSFLFNNKMFYFIIINCFSANSASKTGTTIEIEITEEELTKK